jgi:hypothetical protein
MEVYTKVKAWLALLLGIYLIGQCIAFIVGGSFFTASGVFGVQHNSSYSAGIGLGLGIPVILLGLVLIYFSWKLVSWGWSNI